MGNIIRIGACLPRLRLDRRAMAQAMGWLVQGAGAGRGTRTLGFWDEDSATLAVEAARAALAGDRAESLSFCTTTPPFAEPQNAALIRAALRLPELCRSQDCTGTPRATLLALHAALETDATALIAAGDRPVVQAGSLAEARMGDGGAAVLTGPGEGLFTFLGGASLSLPFLHRSRASGSDTALDWEERWQREAGYQTQIPAAIAAALDRAGVAAEAVDHLVLPCPIPGTGAAVARNAGLGNVRLAADLADHCGDTGTAHPLMMLAAALPQVAPGQLVVLAQFGQGATALVLRAGEAVRNHPGLPGLDTGIPESNYLKLLAFQDRLDWDRGLRGRYIVPEAQSTAFRNAEALLGFVASRDSSTGQIRFPPRADEAGEVWPLADRGGRLATMTADRLAYSRHPPSCYGLVDLNGGGRLMMDLTDPDAAELAVGDALRFVFRVKDIDQNSGFRRYFWKAVRDTAQV
ncbi:OB-fold domain-containing protein [Pararhodobacter marinus]|uniref:OB-fold domain-containing protein n=1 Tax=Pararhodobacter marinus TaxID=2184063 RepID=UPI0035169B3F